MQFSAITTILSLAAMVLAAPTVEVAARGEIASDNEIASNNIAHSCQAAGGDTYCCDKVTPADGLNLQILDGCTMVHVISDLIPINPMCPQITTCCEGPAETNNSGLSILDGATVCVPLSL